MIIAELKKKENIVEYILYIRQLMDIMRANGMDMSKIDELLVSKFEVSEKEKLKIHNWYQNLIETMRNEGVTAHGDIKEIKGRRLMHVNQIPSVSEAVTVMRAIESV